jgi:DNA-binding SARP family transcriptional activator
MRSHALARDRAAAARGYQRCRELLARELGIDPAPATVALFHESLAAG